MHRTCSFAIALALAPTSIDAQESASADSRMWRTNDAGPTNALYLQMRGCGYQVTYDEVAHAVDGAGHPATLARLGRAAEALGARCQVGFGTMQALEATALPVITHMEDATGGGGSAGGYGIVVRTDPASVTIYDADSVLRQQIGREAFKRLWSGHVLSVFPPHRASSTWLLHWSTLLASAGLLIVWWRSRR